MTITGGQVSAGGTIEISIDIENSDPFIAFQLDIPLPGELTYLEGSASSDPDRFTDHSMSVQVISGNTLRIISYSLSNSAYKGNSGKVMSFQLSAANKAGDYALNPVNPIIAGENGGNIITSASEGIVTILAPEIYTDADILRFGRNPLGTYNDIGVYVQNRGNLRLDISDVSFDSPYFELQGDSQFSLTPGSGRNLTVRFNSLEKGDFVKSMSIASNDQEEPLLILTLEATAFAVNELHCGSMLSFSGNKDTLSVSINNMEPFTAFQFDLQLPEPLNYISGAAVLSDRKSDHQVSAGMINENTLRVMAYSPDNLPFYGDKGIILKLPFDVFGQGGWYSLSLSNVIISNQVAENIVSEFYNGALEVAAPSLYCNGSFGIGDVAVNDSKSVNFRISNFGSDVLFIEQLKFTNQSFSTEVGLPFEIPAGNHHDLEIIYQSSQKGEQTGKLQIFSNDPVNNPYEVNLSAYSFSPNYMKVANVLGLSEDTLYIDILVDNYEPFVAFEFKLGFPDQIITFIEENENSYLAGREQDHELNIQVVEPGVLHAFSYSLNQHDFSGNSGAIVRLGFISLAQEGEAVYPLTLSGAILANQQGQNILYEAIDGLLTIFQDILCPDTITTCIDSDPFLIPPAFPEGGTFSGNGVSEGVFDPGLAGNGDHVITYMLDSEISCQFIITVIEPPNVSLGDFEPACENAPAFELTGGLPEGGSYSGEGVTEGGLFDPAQAGPGTFQITYTYTDNNGCSNHASAAITVKQYTGLDRIFSGSTMEIYPNPANDKINIEFDSEHGHINHVWLINASGRILISLPNGTHNKQFQLDLKNIIPGLYLLRISTTNGYFVERILIQ